MRWPRRAVAWLAVAWLAVAGLTLVACRSPARELVALSDEIANSCADLGTRMAEGWLAAERVRRGPLGYEQAGLARLEPERARCRGALELLEELAAERSRLAPPAEQALRGVLTLDRLLLRSVADPTMDSRVFAATVVQCVEGYHRARPRLDAAVPLSAEQRRQAMQSLAPRWNARIEGLKE